MRRSLLSLSCLLAAAMACNTSVTSNTGGSTGGGTAGGTSGGTTGGAGSGGSTGASAAAISAAHSTVAVAGHAGGTLADGVETALISATVRNEAGAPLVGATVTFSVTGASNRVSAPGVSDANGVATATLASTHAESKAVSATASNGAGPVAITATASAAFVQPAVSLTADAGPFAADGGALANLTATVTRGASGPPVPGVKVRLTASGTHNALIHHGVTDSAGVTHAALASATAETKTVAAAVGEASAQTQATFTATNVCNGSLALAGLPWIPASSQQSHAELADMDGDGVLDLVTASQPNSTLNVHTGLGTGLFAPPWVYDASAVVTNLQDFALGDFNQDGVPDVVVLDEHGLVALLSDGLGSFGEVIASGVPAGSGHFLVAELTGDGKLDVAVNGTHNVDILAGDGHGGFASLSGDGNAYLFDDADSIQALAAVDLKGHGVTELLAVTDRTANGGTLRSLVPLVNDGNGVLSAAPSLPLDQVAPSVDLPVIVKAAHLNADAHTDLVVAGGNMQLLLGDGTGHLDLGQAVSLAGTAFSFPEVADVNGDGHDDVLALGVLFVTGGPSVPPMARALLTGHGDGTLATPVLHPDALVSVGWRLADLNGDGVQDGVFVAASASSIAVSLGRPGDPFASDAFLYALPADEPSSAQGLASADLNGDGADDLLLQNANQLVVLLNRARTAAANGNTFVPGPALPGLPAAMGPLAVADFSGDGNQDIVVANGTDPRLTVLTGQGNALFTATQSPNMTGVALALTAADLNGDQHPDLVAVISGDQTLNLLLNMGDGNFVDGVSLDAGGELLTNAQVADVTGDDKVDLLAVVDGVLKVAEGDGTGAFTWQSAGLDLTTTGGGTGGSSSWNAAWILAQDLTGDGKVDVLVSGSGQSNGSLETPPAFVVATGQGDGTFTAGAPFGMSANTMGIPSLADVNRDGVSDLVVPNLAGYLEVFIGHADGTFNPAAFYEAAQQWPLNAVVHDYNGDGLADVALRSANGARVAFNGGCKAPGQPLVERQSCSAAPLGAWTLLLVGGLLARAARRRLQLSGD